VDELARNGAVYVLDKLRERATGKAKTPNLGKIVNDILEKAGIPKWAKPFVKTHVQKYGCGIFVTSPLFILTFVG
jgi:hypothetical protein